MYIQMHVHIYIFLFTSGRDERHSRVLFVTNAVSLALLQPLCVLNAPPLPISSNHHLFWNVETFHRATVYLAMLVQLVHQTITFDKPACTQTHTHTDTDTDTDTNKNTHTHTHVHRLILCFT